MKKVITYGTFDLFHDGHLKLLKRAKELGDYLIVGVTTQHFDEARGKLNIVDGILERIDNIRKTGLADLIIVEDHMGQKMEDIQKYGVDIFTVGSDWVGYFDYLKGFCDVVYLERTPDISSTMLRQDKNQIVNLGIVGTGRMASRLMAESKYVSGINIACAYDPITDNNNFEKAYNITVFHDDYDAFLQNTDAVYIATPNETHYDYIEKTLLAGKHVLCEKPIAFTKKKSEQLYHLAKQHQVILMEAIKAAYSPGFQQLINVAKSGQIGEIIDVEACFTRLANPTSREMKDNQYGGAFLEFGPSTLLPVIKLLGSDYKQVSFDSLVDDNGVDIYTRANIRYPRGFASIKTGLGVKTEGQLVVAGTKGYIIAPSPWWLMKSFEVRYEDPSKIDHYEPMFQGDGLRYEMAEFISKINKSGMKDYKLTAEESIVMSEFVEKFMNYRKKQVK